MSNTVYLESRRVATSFSRSDTWSFDTEGKELSARDRGTKTKGESPEQVEGPID